MKFLGSHYFQTLWWIWSMFGQGHRLRTFMLKVFRTSLFLNSVVYLFHVWHDDRCWSKILCSMIPNPVYDFKVKVTDLEFLYCNFLQFQFLAHLSLRLTRWAYSIPMVRRPSVRRRPSSVVVVVHTFKLEYLWSHLANLDKILYVASLGWGKGCIRFWGRLDQNSGFHSNRNSHWLIMGKTMSPPFLGCFWSDPFYTCR